MKYSTAAAGAGEGPERRTASSESSKHPAKLKEPKGNQPERWEKGDLHGGNSASASRSVGRTLNLAGSAAEIPLATSSSSNRVAGSGKPGRV